MLEIKQAVAFVVTIRPDDALRFYRDILGFKFLRDDGCAFVFDAHGTMLRVGKLQVKDYTAPNNTILGWEVKNIPRAVSQLKKKGVFFERFSQMPQDKDGIWTAPNGDKIAWFKDPDGNVLSLSQHHAVSE